MMDMGDEQLLNWVKRARIEHSRVIEQQKLKKVDAIQHEFADNRWVNCTGSYHSSHKKAGLW